MTYQNNLIHAIGSLCSPTEGLVKSTGNQKAVSRQKINRFVTKLMSYCQKSIAKTILCIAFNETQFAENCDFYGFGDFFSTKPIDN